MKCRQDENRLSNQQGKIIHHQELSLNSKYSERVAFHRITYLSDGLKITGFIIMPKSADDGELFPAIIYNRGGLGPGNKIDESTLEFLAFFADQGYIVTATQYRGNDGSEGAEDYLGKDVNDVINIAELTQSLSCVEPAKIFMIGFSRGGAVGYLALKNGLPVKAACIMGCAVDFVDAYEKLPHYRLLLETFFKGTPDQSLEEYTGRSPAYWPEKINVPLLIIQGTDDHHVPIEQIKRFSATLKSLGKKTDLIIYPEGDHTLNRFQGEKEHKILEWFKQH